MTVSRKLELTMSAIVKPACSNPNRFDDPYLMVGNSGEESRHKPKRSSSYAWQIIKDSSMADFISEIASYPDSVVTGKLPASPALDLLRTHYAVLALGLEYYEIEHEPDRKAELKRQFLFTPRVGLKPDVDLSRAMLAFTEQVWDRSESLQAWFPDSASVWFACEYTVCLYRLREAGLIGIPDLDSQGRVLSKKASLQRINSSISLFEQALLNGPPIRDKSSSLQGASLNAEHFSNLVLTIAIKLANDREDEDLAFYIRQYLRAARHHANLTESSESRQICRMHQGKLKVTGKSKKAFKPATAREKSIGFGVRNVTKC